MYNNDSTKVLRQDYTDKIIKLEETLSNYLGETDIEILKTEYPINKWNYLTKN